MAGHNFTHAAQEARTAPSEAEPASAAALARSRQLWLLFWFGVPLFIGLLLGWAGAGSARLLPKAVGLLFVMSGVLPSWWLYGLTGLTLRRLFPRLALPLVLLLSPVIAAFLLHPVYSARYALFGLPDIARKYAEVEGPLAMILTYLYGNALGIISFPLIALFFLKMFRLDVLQWIGHITAPAAPARPDTQPGVIARLPAHLGTDIHALVAAEHYLRVVTARGEAMVLYRLGDAIRDMEVAGIPGIQTHRSYWIAQAAIAQHNRDGSRLTLITPTGLAVPVSRSYRQALKARTGL